MDSTTARPLSFLDGEGHIPEKHGLPLGVWGCSNSLRNEAVQLFFDLTCLELNIACGVLNLLGD
jgi:hypothetical protein